MVSGDIQLVVNAHTFDFAPSQADCPSCGDGAGYNSSIEVTTHSSDTEVSVTFLCDSCGVDVETVQRTVTAAPDPADSATDDNQEVYNWIENYTDTEGRHPSKSKTVQDLPFEIFEAQQLLDELLDEGRIEKVEELRAGGKITVFKTI